MNNMVSPTKNQVQTVMINVKSYGHRMYLPVLLIVFILP
jgi:hypothetical protein